MTSTKTTAVRDSRFFNVCCENCGFAVQVSKRHVVTHVSNGRRACPK